MVRHPAFQLTLHTLTLHRSLRTSLIALTSIVSIAVATVQYAPISNSASSPEASRPPVIQAVKPFSILDYLPLSVHSIPDPIVTLSSSGAGSYMPDVRLIKNALSLSTKSNAFAPAVVQSTDKLAKPSSQQTNTAKSVGPTSYSLSLRNSDVALTTIIDASTKWHRSLRNLARGADGHSSKDVIPRSNLTGYDSVTRAELRGATYNAVSDGRILDVIYYVHLHFLATLRSEMDEAITFGKTMIGWSVNTTRTTRSRVMAGTSYLRRHLSTGLHSLAIQAHSLRLVKAEEARAVSQKAKAGLDAVSQQASLTHKWGQDRLRQARAGLDYLIAEGQRRRAPTQVGTKAENEKSKIPMPLRGGTKARCDGRAKCGKSWSKWDRKQASCGGVSIPQPPAEPVQAMGNQMTWTQKAFRAIHDVGHA